MKIGQYIVILVLLFSACRSGKYIADAQLQEQVKESIIKLESNKVDFETLKARIKTKYIDKDGKSQGFTTYLRVKKDSIIWANINVSNIPIASILISPDSVKVLLRTKKEYYPRGIDYLQKQLGNSDIQFKDLQDIIVGNALWLDTNLVYYKNKENNSITNLNLLEQERIRDNRIIEKDYIVEYWINEQYKLSKTRIESLDRFEELIIDQKSYQDIDGFLLPFESEIKFMQVNDSTQIDLKFNKIELNKNLSFPFKVTQKYKVIE